jgi:hypothetical protein
MNTETRALSEIAQEVRQDWKNVYFGAEPYLDAMSQLTTLTDAYGADSARTIVSYFLANATSWRGSIARELKAELRSMLG